MSVALIVLCYLIIIPAIKYKHKIKEGLKLPLMLICIHSIGDLNQSHGLNYDLYPENLQRYISSPWLVWLSELSASLSTKGASVGFPVRAHAWVAGQVPSSGCARGNHTLMFLSLFLLPFPSL